MKIGYLLYNRNIRDKDLSHPERGNPGVGGTEYMIVSVVSYLHRLCGSHEVLLFAESAENLPPDITVVQFDDLSDLSAKIAGHGVDILVARYSVTIYNDLRDMPCRLVYWLHNFEGHYELCALADDRRVAALVPVGREQLNQYRDYEAFYKSAVIFNGYPVTHILEGVLRDMPEYSRRPLDVVYVGSIVHYKGFHVLAKAWRSVLARVPDARLHVIGGGNLYNPDVKMGPYGIAEEQYERCFMPYLCDDNGRILPSVIFHGVMGEEKFDVMRNCRVGVPNPTAASETFCISAIEMQLCGCRIATVRRNGFLDTVYPGTGILFENEDDLAASIVRLLGEEQNDYEGCVSWLRQFDFSTVARQWDVLFDTLEQEGDLSAIRNDNYRATSGRYRWLEWNRRVKKMLPWGRRLPTVFYYNAVLQRLKEKLGMKKQS